MASPSVLERNKQTPAAFPLEEVQRLLHRELEEAASDGAILHGGWEPVLDSLRVVSTLLSLEGLFSFKLPPEKLVKRGGYPSVDEALSDMSSRLEKMWKDHNRSEAQK